MTEKLTDEQLREWAKHGSALTHQWKEVATELLALRAERAKPTQGDYSPTEHERVLAGDIIETVTDFDLEYDERTEAVFLAFASILTERAKTTQGDEERVNELCNDHNEDGSQSPHLAKDILALIASIRAEHAKATPSDEERARVLAIAVLTNCAMRYIEGPQSQVDRAIDLGTRTVLPFFASIRAEGSAERAKLEAADIARILSECLGYEDPIGFEDAAARIVGRAQPAESGATEHLESEECGQLSDEDELASTIAFHRHIGSTPHAEARAILAGAKP